MNPQPVPPARYAGELLTVEQAADRIRMSARGCYRLGRSVRIDPAELTAFVTAGRIDPITETTVWNDLRGVG